jgi:hypothetical protein
VNLSKIFMNNFTKKQHKNNPSPSWHRLYAFIFCPTESGQKDTGFNPG